MDYNDALKFINSKLNFGSKPGTSRIIKLMELCGNPHKNINYIHVAGTNGKGSVSFMLSSILKEAGYKTGLYISPSITDFRERIQMNGNYIPKDKLSKIVEYLKPLVNNSAFENDPITEFELTTAIAFNYFKEEGCDIAIIETGMGGKLDATNIIQNPICSIVTSVSKDHTQILGNTIREIANEKFGIIKPFCPIIIGQNQDEEVYEIAKNISEEINSPMFIADSNLLKNISVSEKDGISFEYNNLKIKTGLRGEYQVENIATVCKALDMIKEKLFMPGKKIIEGFKNVKIPCRLETVSQSPKIILDAAHNIAGIKKLKQFIISNYKKENLIGVMGMFKDKDTENMIKEIAPCFEKIFTVEPDSPRKLSLKQITECSKKYNSGTVSQKSITLAIKNAVKISNDKTVIVVFGSFSIMKEAKEAI